MQYTITCIAMCQLKFFPFQIAPAADVNTNQFAFAQPGGEGQQAGVGVPQQGFNF